MERDEAEAMRWFRAAADQGHAEAQNQLGVAYAEGDGVERDDMEAVRWYRADAAGGWRAPNTISA